MTEWWKKSTVYQIYPRSFMDSNGDGIGDIRGIIQKLDYLHELGVDILWLSPVYDSPNDDNGYDIRDYYEIMKEFGTMADFDELLEKVHARDMKLVMDLVVNHTSDEHAWFKDHPDFYIWRDQPTNWRSFFGGSTWEYQKERNQYYLHLFSKKQPDLNWENPEMRTAVYEMMRWWLDKGVDGFRMDVINMISKVPDMQDAVNGDASSQFMNGPNVHTYLKEMNTQVLSQYNIVTVGETPGTTPKEARDYTAAQNQELNMIFTFEHMDLDQASGEKWDLKPLDLIDLKENLEKWQHGLYDEGWNSLYWNNHDQPRIVSRFGDDQKWRVESAKMLATCLHFMQGTPYIYQGEELGMTNVRFDAIEEYKDIETINMYQEKRAAGISHDDIMMKIYAKGRDNARTPMQWSDAPNGGFTTGTPWIKVNPNYTDINAAQHQEPDSIYQYYKKLIAFRKNMGIITYGDFQLLHHEDKELFAYTRTWNRESLTIYCNFSNQPKTVERPEGDKLIGNYDCRNGEDELVLKPYEAVVYYK
ncbi:Oligo-1,6-glucosidase [Planococcus halocryophilus Or1]|uniref:oligo-1,6-glucosidase n=1 Tax=Planococcus halocryophilus TaxID=1215089 RepID=A0A1C7DVE8_9BACL|nr:alpha-glucosidase [Planococcus halocryophilus]ANU15193.1 glucohydrolase [Planococcus halocryophilus]EMF47007.1 Oligo-1,6-glucosidase [Planococcus halocryophilus Or1]